MKEISESTDSMKEQMIKADKKVIYLRREIKVREHYIEKIQKELQIKKQKVSDLEDVLNHRESQLYNDKNKTKK
jgi:shikimate kinase